MEHNKHYLIQATALGKDNHWEPRYAIYNADGRPTKVLAYRALHVHESTHAAAIESALRFARNCIDEEM